MISHANYVSLPENIYLPWTYFLARHFPFWNQIIFTNMNITSLLNFPLHSTSCKVFSLQKFSLHEFILSPVYFQSRVFPFHSNYPLPLLSLDKSLLEYFATPNIFLTNILFAPESFTCIIFLLYMIFPMQNLSSFHMVSIKLNSCYIHTRVFTPFAKCFT